MKKDFIKKIDQKDIGQDVFDKNKKLLDKLMTLERSLITMEKT